MIDVADAVGAERFDLVGHDFGGMVAWMVAGHHPDRVRTLTVASTPHPAAFRSSYQSTSTDTLLNQYETTTSAATQQTILNKLQEVMLNDAPVIPVVEAVDWFQYDTGAFTGWPTPDNPYALPSVYSYPDNEQLLLKLSPK